jgi:hypothetical protein
MKYISTPSHYQSIDPGIILQNMNPLRKPSFIPQTDMGDALYEWGDSLVENMSSVRLAAILRHRHGASLMENFLITAAKQELIKRGHYEHSMSWNVL